jgi:F-type H+-transporting ATPase subunit a
MAALAFRPEEENDHETDHDVPAKDDAHQHDGEEHADAANHEHDDHAGGSHGEHAGHDHGHHADLSTPEGKKSFFLGKDHLLNHVLDQPYFEVPSGGPHPHHLELPNPFGKTWENPVIASPNKFVAPTTFQPTKFVALELIAAVLIAAIVIPYARRVKNGDRPRGKFWNLIDVVVCYIKNEVAEPAIGKSDAKRFLPLLWTIFFFVLTLNLFGMIPGVGAATGSITVTAALAMVVFLIVVGSGSKKMGVLGFWKAQVPHMDLHPALAIVLVPMIWAIEVFGLFVKHAVLAVRLFANMFAGHMVLAVFIAFVGVFGYASAVLVGPAVLGISLLELMVAFIQAYVFTFLSALFIGAAVHPH